MKHAYLIMAHNEWRLLHTLVSAIDDARNDIYIHIDAKAGALPEIYTLKAGLFFLDKRINVNWGGLSVVEAEYELFASAYKPGKYSYYHLLSGTDLPLKSQNYIHSFCEEHSGKEFIGYTLLSMSPELVRRVCRWHLFPESFKETGLFKRAVRKAFIFMQECLGIRRNKGTDFRKGTQWCSITENLVKEILDRRQWALKAFSHTFCPDEMLVQTICWNSPLRENIWCLEGDAQGCMRAIGWKDGELVDWGSSEYETLASSSALFARKFNCTDWDFINRVLALSK